MMHFDLAVRSELLCWSTPARPFIGTAVSDSLVDGSTPPSPHCGKHRAVEWEWEMRGNQPDLS